MTSGSKGPSQGHKVTQSIQVKIAITQYGWS